MLRPLTSGELKELELAMQDELPPYLVTRVHRAISWLERAEHQTEDADVAFILYWVSFNALYAQDKSEWVQASERTAFSSYFSMITELDVENSVYDALWDRFSNPIRNLLDNKFVFQPFWNHYGEIPGYENWEEQLHRSKEKLLMALSQEDTKLILTTVFDRLYVLRNQLFHGAATWRGKVNRPQVKDGARILAFLLPIFIDLMLKNPQHPWGEPTYPVVES